MTAKRRPENGFAGFRLGVRRLPAASFSKECNRRRFSPAGLRSSLRSVSGPGLRSSPVLRPGCRRISPVGLRSSLRPVSGPPVPGAWGTGDLFSPAPGAGRTGDPFSPVPGAGGTGDPFSPAPGAGRTGDPFSPVPGAGGTGDPFSPVHRARFFARFSWQGRRLDSPQVRPRCLGSQQ